MGSLSTDGLRLVATSDRSPEHRTSPFYDEVFAAVARGAESSNLHTFLEEVDDRTGDDNALVVVARRI